MKTYSKSQLDWLEEVLSERICKDIKLSDSNVGFVTLELRNKQGAIKIRSNDGFLVPSDSDFPCSNWLVEEGWTHCLKKEIPAPGYLELKTPLINNENGSYTIEYDILGLMYWMLSRLEEVDSSNLDEYSRFPAAASHGFKHDYIERPIVDEWIYILTQIMRKTWPEVCFNSHLFQMKVSHDVDIPSRYMFQGFYGVVRRMASDIIKCGDFQGAIRGFVIYLSSGKVLMDIDPMNRFDWIMDQSDRNNLKSAFYFLCGNTNKAFDGDYDLDHSAMRALLRNIHKRGHEIGLHPSYESYSLIENIKLEADRLRMVCAEEKVVQDEWGGRMHFLRWKHPDTLYGWERANMAYDSTMGYADNVGFRCGTCFEYPAFDPIQCIQLGLRIRPLIVMDVTLISYMGLGTGREAFDKIQSLKSSCKAVNGVFTLLWHNNNLKTKTERKFYASLLE